MPDLAGEGCANERSSVKSEVSMLDMLLRNEWECESYVSKNTPIKRHVRVLVLPIVNVATGANRRAVKVREIVINYCLSIP